MKRFILGVGAQKAGTTWLHDYLVSRDGVDMGFVKEYHVFDLMTLEECAGFKRKLDAGVVRAAQRNYNRWRSNAVVRRWEFIDYPEKYFDYFAEILSQKGISHTGDITPSYSGLRVETLQYIKDEFAKRDIEVHPIFLMRDPVQRLRSAIKMQLRNKNISAGSKQELAHMRKRCGDRGDQLRANYERTVGNLDSVFGDKVFYDFFENLFCDETVFAICDYLHMERKPGVYNVRKNASPSENELPKRALKRFVKHYQDQYDFCKARFGESKIDAIWQNF